MTRHITSQQGNNHQHTQHKKQNKQTIYTANDAKQHLKTAIANPL